MVGGWRVEGEVRWGRARWDKQKGAVGILFPP